ncbi:MAG TPA: hypothetical protein DEB25_05555 [Desulfobulbaceae bacterium]|nr:hypothetical protein [Desulfobulbaceae bacterium]
MQPGSMGGEPLFVPRNVDCCHSSTSDFKPLLATWIFEMNFPASRQHLAAGFTPRYGAVGAV